MWLVGDNIALLLFLVVCMYIECVEYEHLVMEVRSAFCSHNGFLFSLF